MAITIAGQEVNVATWPRPDTRLAIQWVKTARRMRGLDRGTSADVYRTSIDLVGQETAINSIWTNLKANRTAVTVGLGTGEEAIMFGADVQCTAAVIVEYGIPRQDAWGIDGDVMTLRLTLQALLPTFIGSASLSPLANRLREGYTRGSEFDINKIDSYNGTFTYSDHAAEMGVFKARFDLTTDEIRSVRRYLATTARANTITFPTIYGADYPFGIDKGTGPYQCKVTSWKDGGKTNFAFWRLEVEFSLVET